MIPGTIEPIYCETSTASFRRYLPNDYRHIAFKAVHNISHPGIRTTRKIIQDRYFWPSMNIDIGNWAKQCIACQQSKVQRHTRSNMETFSDCDRFQHIHLDIVGQLPTTVHGHRYLLTVIDRTTCWPEAVPMKEMKSEAVAKHFYESWICRFGCPTTITTDQGRPFESQL